MIAEHGSDLRDSPMSATLKVGDRVRVIVASHETGYRYGDTGTVYRVDETKRGVRYHVAMDKAWGTGTTVIFAADEIEPGV
jgi:hypothetical protein